MPGFGADWPVVTSQFGPSRRRSEGKLGWWDGADILDQKKVEMTKIFAEVFET